MDNDVKDLILSIATSLKNIDASLEAIARTLKHEHILVAPHSQSIWRIEHDS